MTVEVCAASFDYWTKDIAIGVLNSEERQTVLSNASVYYIEIKILYLNILNIHRKKKNDHQSINARSTLRMSHLGRRVT